MADRETDPGLLSFGEYRPDVADYEGQHSREITNVVPQGDGYGPFPSLSEETIALPGPCRGAFYAIKNDGTVAVFAATSTNLYLLNGTSGNWANISLSGGPYTALPDTDNWTFAQFNNFVFATQQNVPVQVIDLTSPTAFANLAGSPPQAKYIAVINQFVVLSGLAAPNVYRIQWSGLGLTTQWTAGVNQSSFLDFADGGIVRGVAGGEFGIVFQDRAIRRMTYSPGSPVIFDFARIASDDGLFAPYSIVSAVEQTFFLSPQGFKRLVPGDYPTPIGKERVDRTFFNDLDLSNLRFVVGSVDPRKQRVYWAYKSVNGPTGAFDRMLCYDWVLDRWTLIKMAGQFITTMERPGITLEGVDAIYGNIGAGTPVLVVSVGIGGSGAGSAFQSNAFQGNAFQTVASISAGDVWTVAASPPAGQGLNFTTDGALPSGYAVGVPYYVKATGRTSTTFKLSASGGVGQFEGSAVTSLSSGFGTVNYFAPSVDNLTVATLDGISVSAQPQLAGFNGNNALGFFTGPNLEATLETAQHGAGPRRIYVRGYKPIADTDQVFGSITSAENLASAMTASTEDLIDARGWVWPGLSTRYARARMRIPAATDWTFAAGVEPDVATEGQR